MRYRGGYDERGRYRFVPDECDRDPQIAPTGDALDASATDQQIDPENVTDGEVESRKATLIDHVPGADGRLPKPQGNSHSSSRRADSDAGTGSPAIVSDQCPECRAAPGAEHAEGCPVSQTGHTPDSGNIFPENPTFPDAGNIAWACLDCGVDRWGQPGIATWHEGKCDICGEVKSVTEPRDFGAKQSLAPNLEFGEALDKVAEQVNVPLEVQERLFEHEFIGIVRQLAQWLDELEEPDYECKDAELRNLALSRLRSGYEQYGSQMYTWSPERRRREVMEELADAICYLTSGPIE